jgi:methylphosphotriester-DNA--protein-cysteine methyltransferase
MTSAQLSRYFKQDFGISPKAYKDMMRVMKAANLLLAKNAIVDVYQEIGFESLVRFYETFKKVAKTSPGKYQK